MLKKGQDLFFLQDWQVNPSTNTLQRGEQTKQLEPKAMDVLLLLCSQQGHVLSADEIATQCWGGVDIGDNPVHKAVTQLRKALGDKASDPTYIETIRKRGYHIIAQLDFPLDEELKAETSSWHDASPFPGLVPFSAKDAQVFFGRNEQIATLLEVISNQVTAKHAFTLILGPSGTGKSSLVNAGLLPRLISQYGYNGIGVVSHTSIDFADISQERLFIDLASAMLDWDVNDQPVFDGMSAEKLAEQLQNNIAASIQQCVKALQGAKNGYGTSQFLLFIDRLEVLLSSPIFSNNERQGFLNLIEALTVSGAIIVISACRNDFYPLVVNHPSLMANKGDGGHFDLLAPSRAELMQMIRLPAVAANLTWSIDKDTAIPLDQILCDEAANNPDALPMLQYTLQELYLQRSSANELQIDVYKALGGIEGAIGKKAEEVYQQLPSEHQPHLATVLSRLITLSPDGETITSRAARWAELTEPSQTAFIEAMVDSRLFVSHLQNGEPCFSLAHEALLRRWPRANEWINQHKDSLTIKGRLQQLTKRWVNEGKSAAYLLPKGKPLEEAISLRAMPMFTLDYDELDLIKASQQKITTKRWLNRSITILLCLLTFTAIFMSVKSQQAEALAQQKRLEAESLLGFMVGEFADKLRSVKRMDLLDGISNKALEYFSQQNDSYDSGGLFSLADSEHNFKAQFQHAQTLGAMGEVAYSRGKNEEAAKAFSAAKLILNKLYQLNSNNLELLKTLGANAFWLGQLAYDQSDYDRAQPLFELYRDYSTQMNELEPNNVDGWVELSYAQNTLGSLYLKLQKYNYAKEAFTSSLKLKERALAQNPESSYISIDIADTFSWLAETELHFGKLSESLEAREQGQRILTKLLQTSPNNARIMELLVQSHQKLASIFEIRQEYNDSLSNLLVAKQLIQALLEQDQSNEYWRDDLLFIEPMEKFLRTKLGLYVNKGLSDHENLTNEILSDKAISLELLVKIIRYLQVSHQWSESDRYISLTNSQFLITENIETVNQKRGRFLAELEMLKAKNFSYKNNIKSTHNACQKVIERLAPMVSKTNHPNYLLPFVQAHSCIGQLSKINTEQGNLQRMGITNFNFTVP
ncbi:winged helix-turn-helix domain-containing protein [Paraglaciecola sp. 2405UD69-4]|uniref:nSTAND1 domain-containing NTPase n=1 Tax=Paraglaciecola sp. 2405UD69-4 TaxID=3391836 RepID=UPI0039C8E635